MKGSKTTKNARIINAEFSEEPKKEMSERMKNLLDRQKETTANN